MEARPAFRPVLSDRGPLFGALSYPNAYA